jgi:hypothetical protein
LAARQGDGRESLFVFSMRILVDSRVRRNNRCMHRGLQRAPITFPSREIHSLSLSSPGKIILQIPAMSLGLFQKQ